MTVSRYSAKFRAREDVFDNITPTVTVQKDVSAPHGPWKPAPWLPIVFTKSDIGGGTDYFVVSSGKVLAMDRENYLVPAGLRAKIVSDGLTYTSTDYDQEVTDLTTGAAYATNGSTTYTLEQIAEALIERGLVSMDETTEGSGIPDDAADPAATRQEIVEAFIGLAVGVAAYDFYVWSGRPEDGDQKFANYSKQHLVQFLTQLQMKVPHRTTQTSSDAFDVSVIDAGALKVTAVTAGGGDFPEAGEVWLETALDDIDRYASSADGQSVVAWKLDERPVAANTSRTPISCDVSGVLVDEKTSIAGISAEGDWYLDAEVGIIFTHSDTYDTLVAANSDPTFTYYFYAVSGSTGASSDRYVFFDGEGKPGDRLSYDANSNFVVMASAQDALGTSNDFWLARLHKIVTEPRSNLDKVKTAFQLTGLGATSQMPGSATSGYSDLITLATDEEIADQVAILTLLVR